MTRAQRQAAATPPRPRRAQQQQAQRQRRAQRELQQALRERAEQDAAPRNDPLLLPRIDYGLRLQKRLACAAMTAWLEPWAPASIAAE